ncbi:superoxide dismutase family protein [Roseinatronobacter alkalisoli]|uniref:Superoxide dismutase [Cu-Zn] n=1 Tax=Roseinatronobacter alkalisoli TaxID=3028235 RepID=A0ABT5T8Q2_9RHOB|nr:superoxide dismutase family protein [Roseinatronobacter sp. HJB301]MDD7971090.1 superoxide dismutase family protein [Roseinatronobacter sp. HJB301]
MIPLRAFAIASVILAAPAAAQTGETATASFIDQDGQETGNATLTQTNAGVLIELEVADLPPESWIAFHIHEEGVCDADHDHEGAGGHFSPSESGHGFLSGDGPHEGDMPNQYVPADGVLRAQVLNAMVALDGGETDLRGGSLMLHAEPDDYVSQPSGDAGARIACAVIE